MAAVVIDPAALADRYLAEIKTEVAELDHELTLTGIVTAGDGPALTYAQYSERAAGVIGARFNLAHVEPQTASRALAEANLDPGVDGVFLYYPLISHDDDRWAREVTDPRKDVEGMHSFWSRCLYENRRTLSELQGRAAILPCTPLAIRKLIAEAAPIVGREDHGGTGSLAGLRAVVFNRSDIVGRPLSAMLANDGAEVINFDIAGPVRFTPAIGSRNNHDVVGVEIERAAALAEADIVVTGVPSRDFQKISGDELKPGAICINFSSIQNMADSVIDTAAVYIPRVGPMTVAMALRNAVRLASYRADHE